MDQVKQIDEDQNLISHQGGLTEQVMHLKGLEQRDNSIKEREQEFSLLQTRFLNKVQQKKRELQQFAGDLKQTKKDLEQKQSKLNDKEITLNRLSENLKKQQKFMVKKISDIEEQQMKIDFLEGNFSEKQMIINKQLQNLQKGQEDFQKHSLQKQLQFKRKEDHLRQKDLKLLDKQKRLTELELKETMIQNQLQTLSQNEYSLLKSQAEVKSRQKELEQRQKQIQESEKKFNFRVEDLSKAFKLIQIQKSQINDNQNQLNLQKLAMEEIEQKFLQEKTEQIETIKKKSLELIMEKDVLNKQRSQIQITSKKIDFKESLLNDQSIPYNINKKQKELKGKQLELLEKQLQIELQKQELENKIDEISSLLGQLTQWTSLPLPFMSKKQHILSQSKSQSLGDIRNELAAVSSNEKITESFPEKIQQEEVAQSKESLFSSSYLDAIQKMQSNLSKSHDKKLLV